MSKMGNIFNNGRPMKMLQTSNISNLHIPLPNQMVPLALPSQNFSEISARIEKNASSIDSILNSICANSSPECRELAMPGNIICSTCEKVLCKHCLSNSSCFKCSKNVCKIHCIQCHICNKKSCKSKNCISDFRICQLCEYTFCQEHFEAHKDFNTKEEYGIKCLTKKCKMNFKIQPDGIKRFISSIINACLIKELKLRNIVIRRK